MVLYLPSDGLCKDSMGALREIVKAHMPTITTIAWNSNLISFHTSQAAASSGLYLPLPSSHSDMSWVFHASEP
jgi:hypothetical protein